MDGERGSGGCVSLTTKRKTGGILLLSFLILMLSIRTSDQTTFQWDPDLDWQGRSMPPGSSLSIGTGKGTMRMTTSTTASACVDIPSNISLCHGIGYNKMRLPNLLHHETLHEVSQQTVSWIPLFQLGCHPDTQLFLCSLFTPVCLDHPIPPCRSLCHTVQSSCEVTMSRYGYPWPDIVKCDQFPADNDMCISEQHAKGGVGGLGPSPSSSLPVSHYDVYPDGTPMGVTSSPSSSRVPSSTEGSKGKTGSRSKKRKKKRKQHHHHHHPHDRQVNPNNNSDNSQGNKGISSSGENSSSHSQQHHAHHHRDHRIIRIEEQEEHEERSHVPDISQDQDVEPAGRRILPPSSMIDAASPSSSTLSYGSRNSMSTPSPHHVHHHLQNFDQLRHELEEEGTTTTSPVTTYQSILLPRDNGPSSPHQQAGTSSRAGGSVLSSIDSNADDVAATSSSGQHQPGHDHRERQKRVNASGRVSASPSPEPLWIQMRDAYCMSEWSLKGRGRLSLDSRAGHQLSTSSIHEQGKESQTGGRRRKGSARVSMHQVVNRMANMPEFLFIQIQGYKVLHGSFDVGRETAAPLPASKDTPIEITIPNSVMQQFVQLIQPDSNSDHHHSKDQEIAGGRMRRGDGNSSSRSRKRTTKRPIEPSDNREPLESGEEEAKSIRFYVMGFTSGSGQHLASFLMPWNSKDKELRMGMRLIKSGSINCTEGRRRSVSATAAASATNVKDSMMTTTTSMTTVAPAERETGMDEDKGATSATSSSSSSSSSSSTSSRSSTRTVAHDQDPAKNDGASDGRMTFPGETWFTTSLPVFGGAAAAPPVLGVNVTAPSLPSESSSRGVLVPETLLPSSFSFPTIPAPTAGGTTTHSTYSHRHQSQRHHLPHDFPDGERISAWDLHPITLHQSHILFPLTGVTSTDSSIVDVGSTRPTKSKSKRRGRRKKKKERKQDRDEKPDSDPNDQPDDGNKEDRSQTCNHCPKYPGSGSESVI